MYDNLTIGRLAKAAGVNVETIRYYQRRGLVDEPHKPLGGHRRYSPVAASRVRFIKRAQQLGFTLAVLEPGKPTGMYHAESDQEDFLVLAGTCLLVIEEEERELRTWDFVHCPPGTRHTFVGTGGDPCVIFMTGARTEDGTIVYLVSETARAHGAGVEAETPSPREAYAPFAHWRLGRPGAWPRLPWS